MGFLGWFIGIFARPREAMDDLHDAGLRASIPAVLLQIAATIALFYFYYNAVNFDWLLEQILKNIAPEQKSSTARLLSPVVLFTSTSLIVCLTSVVVLAITALYFYLVGKIHDWPESYGQWWLFSSWTSLPSILILPLGLLMIFSSNGRLPTDELNPLALNVLLQIPADSVWRTFTSSISAVLVYTLSIAVIGLQIWTKISIGKAISVVLSPYILIFGTWALIIGISALL